MQKKSVFLLLAILLGASNWAFAQAPSSDSIDVLHYNLAVDLGATVQKQLRGVAEIQFVLTKPCDAVTFDLICDTLHPVSLDGMVIRGFNYDRDNSLLHVYLRGGQPGDTHLLAIPYVSNGYVEHYGWGGMHFDNNIYYNLGVAFQEYPHVYGRAWFPCRDNMYDKATYSLTVTSQPGWRAICSGLRQNETTAPDGTTTSRWTITQPTPTYLVSVSSAPWHIIEREYTGLHGTYPAIIGFLAHDSTQVQQAFDILDDIVPAYERAFGPYRWDRIGYISTPQGSMEHVSNIGLVSQCAASTDSPCQMTMCHELGHAWFGNLITCTTPGDMWINEGGASFCEEVAAAAAYGTAYADQYYQQNLNSVILKAHKLDYGYRSLSGMDERYTYGSTTYNKGALVWHSLRGTLGDSLFYACMQRLFDACAFGNIDAAGLRDSLSLYSGMDLTPFFDFHVFNPGFVDYELERFASEDNYCVLTLRQLLRGTDHYAIGCRVPVTFFSADRSQRQEVWLTMEDTLATFSLTLPFHADFAIVDYSHRISDACVTDTVRLTNRGTTPLSNTYCRLYLPEAPTGSAPWVHIGHHFAHPVGDSVPGIIRMTNRYWQVTGSLTNNPEGFFLYNRGSYGGRGASYIDEGFYEEVATLDSLCLLYRPSADSPWQVISRTRTGNSSIDAGYFRAHLFNGQYTLGVCDPETPLMHVGTVAEQPSFLLFPNPTTGKFTIRLDGYDKKFDLLIYDLSGRKVLEMRALSDGDTLHPSLPAGTYIAIIQNNFLSLQSQIIVQ